MRSRSPEGLHSKQLKYKGITARLAAENPMAGPSIRNYIAFATSFWLVIIERLCVFDNTSASYLFMKICRFSRPIFMKMTLLSI